MKHHNSLNNTYYIEYGNIINILCSVKCMGARTYFIPNYIYTSTYFLLLSGHCRVNDVFDRSQIVSNADELILVLLY